jgi:acetylornithine aminotransferase
MTDAHLIPTYNRQPLAFARGEGVWLYDEAGNRYLDALSGIAVNTLGHAHPALTAAISEQAARLLHCSNLYHIPSQEALAATLCEKAGMAAAFFCNSGAEANEAAIKLARLHGHRRGADTPRIAVMEGAFHGRTLATLAATGNAKAQDGFGPMPEGFVRVPYGRRACRRPGDVRGSGGTDSGRRRRTPAAGRLSARTARALRRSRLAADAR